MSPARVGPVSQRDLLTELIPLIDAAMVQHPSAHRDIARSRLRALLDTAHWRTPFIGHNVGARRSRWLNSFGYWTPSSWTIGGWTGPRAEAPEAEE